MGDRLPFVPATSTKGSCILRQHPIASVHASHSPNDNPALLVQLYERQLVHHSFAICTVIILFHVKCVHAQAL